MVKNIYLHSSNFKMVEFILNDKNFKKIWEYDNEKRARGKMKFRKKPIVIEAEQWFPGKEIEGVITRNRCWDFDEECEPYIKTLEGKMNVSKGDWIIKGVAGEFYPCKPDIFEKTYEKISE